MRTPRAAAAAVLAAAVLAPSAVASTDFYYRTSCSVSPDGKARLSASFYDHRHGTEMHLDLNSSIPVFGARYYAHSIVVNGATYVRWNDMYVIRWDRDPIKVTGVWTVSGVKVRCTRYFNPPAA